MFVGGLVKRIVHNIHQVQNNNQLQWPGVNPWYSSVLRELPIGCWTSLHYNILILYLIQLGWLTWSTTIFVTVIAIVYSFTLFIVVIHFVGFYTIHINESIIYLITMFENEHIVCCYHIIIYSIICLYCKIM